LAYFLAITRFSGFLTNGCLFVLIRALLGELCWGEALFYLFSLLIFSYWSVVFWPSTLPVFLRVGETILRDW